MSLETLQLAANDWVPNNPRRPVVIYRQVLVDGDAEHAAAAFEELFRKNGWPPQWRDGIFDCHHYHSNAHEVLGCAAGWAKLLLGGPGANELDFVAGDAVLVPAGTGHCRIKRSADFLVVGAYPAGQHFDICRAAPTPEMLRTIAAVPFPTIDPVLGTGSMA